MKISIKLSPYRMYFNFFKRLILLFIISLICAFFTNAQVIEDTILVGKGWNMIGSLYNGSASDIIRTEPAGILASAFFGYNPGGGYQSRDTLEKGVGYWIKVSQDGRIILGGTSGWTCGNSMQYSGKIYHTVLIGNQCWFKENLDVGVWIDGVIDPTDNGTIEKFCYDDDPANCNVYGGLYAWDEAMQYNRDEGARGICPQGWHIPTYGEFQTLITTVGGDGNALKAVGQGSGDGAGTNTSGFSGLLSGVGPPVFLGDPLYININIGGYFYSSYWSDVPVGAYRLELYSDKSSVYIIPNRFGSVSIRCIKN